MTILEEEEEEKKKKHIVDRQRLLPATSSGGSSRTDRVRLRVARKVQRKARVSSPLFGPSSSAERPNSDDEYGDGFFDEEVSQFAVSLLKTRGFRIKKMRDDGSCMFRAIADQVFGDQEKHDQIRRLCMDYMEQNRDHFSQFVTEEFSAYIARKRLLHVHGNHVELQAVAEIFSRPLEIYEYSSDPITIFAPRPQSSEAAPLRVSYHGNTHYNSVIDPFSPARRIDANIELSMLRDKLRMSDWQRTEHELHSQMKRQSYEEYLSAFRAGSVRVSPRQKRSREDSSPSPPLLSKRKKKSESPRSSTAPSPPRERQVSGSPPKESRSLYEELLESTFNEFGDAETCNAAMLAQAMVLSQQEFLQRFSSSDDASSSRH